MAARTTPIARLTTTHALPYCRHSAGDILPVTSTLITSPFERNAKLAQTAAAEKEAGHKHPKDDARVKRSGKGASVALGWCRRACCARVTAYGERGSKATPPHPHQVHAVPCDNARQCAASH